ncbi:MAG: M20 family metallopeptidase [Bacillota bacterium]
MVDVDVCSLIKPDELIKVVQDLVKIKSINPPGEEAEVAEYVRDYMQARDVPTEICEISPNRYNVVSRLKGQGNGPALIFTGHMDVVSISEEERKRWIVEPFSGEIRGGYLYGRGSVDMKAGLGAAMVALGSLSKQGLIPRSDILLVATVDEEDLMRGAKALIETDLLSGASHVVVCEPTNMHLATCSRGRTWAEVNVAGETAHASREGAGINAINRAVLLINRMLNYSIPHQKHPVLGGSFWQATMIKGGIEPAIIPDSCSIIVDARLVPGQTPDDIWGHMQEIINDLGKEVPGFAADIKIVEKREPWETPDDDVLVCKLTDACQKADLPVERIGFLGTTDGTVFRRAGMEAVIIGPGDLALAHKENERVLISQLIKACEVYYLTMLAW